MFNTAHTNFSYKFLTDLVTEKGTVFQNGILSSYSISFQSFIIPFTGESTFTCLKICASLSISFLTFCLLDRKLH